MNVREAEKGGNPEREQHRNSTCTISNKYIIIKYILYKAAEENKNQQQQTRRARIHTKKKHLRKKRSNLMFCIFCIDLFVRCTQEIWVHRQYTQACFIYSLPAYVDHEAYTQTHITHSYIISYENEWTDTDCVWCAIVFVYMSSRRHIFHVLHFYGAFLCNCLIVWWYLFICKFFLFFRNFFFCSSSCVHYSFILYLTMGLVMKWHTV